MNTLESIDDETTDWRRFQLYISLILFLAIGYPLSLGPLIALSSRHDGISDLIRPISFAYLPLQWLYETWEPATAVIDWYLVFWL